MTDNIQNSGQASDCTSKTVALNAGTVEEINGFEARPVSYKTFEEQLEKRLKPNTENPSIEEALRVSQEVTSLKDAYTSTGAEAAVSFYLCPEVHELPLRPPPAIESNYVQYFVTGCALSAWRPRMLLLEINHRLQPWTSTLESQAAAI